MDHIDRIIEAWRREHPDVDVTDVGQLARLLLYAHLADEALAEWSNGVPLSCVRELVEDWPSGFDWRAQEWRLNAHPGSSRRSTASRCTSSTYDRPTPMRCR